MSLHRVQADVLDALQVSYKEVLDATKHQDDKVGRLLTGFSFLTAAALAIANFGSGQYISKQYSDLPGVAIAVVPFAAFLVLVIVAVILLLHSLSTPLRVPGLSPTDRVKPSWLKGAKVSQIYFGGIATVPIREWEEKWENDPERLKQELAQSLVLETHNLAVRTQYKYTRTGEAVTVFNLALMFLTLTIAFCVSAALLPAATTLPYGTRWGLGIAVALYVFMHLLGQTRYLRQTIDEMAGWRNWSIALARYSWALVATAWTILAGSGFESNRTFCNLVKIGVALLLISTILERIRSKLRVLDEPLHWFIPGAALAAGIGLNHLVAYQTYISSLLASVLAACGIAAYTFVLPTAQNLRAVWKYEHRNSKAGRVQKWMAAKKLRSGKPEADEVAVKPERGPAPRLVGERPQSGT